MLKTNAGEEMKEKKGNNDISLWDNKLLIVEKPASYKCIECFTNFIVA